MRSLFSRQKQGRKYSKLYIIIRFWWVQKMERLVFGLSKVQLCCCLILFMVLGTSLCFHIALKGFSAFRGDGMRIDAVSAIRPAYTDYKAGPILLNTSIKKDEKQSDLSRYIDSVLEISVAKDLRQRDYSKDKVIWSIPITEENKTAYDK